MREMLRTIREALCAPETRGFRWTLLSILGALSLILGLLVYMSVELLNVSSRLSTRDVLEYDEPVRVSNRLPGVVGPALYIGDTVRIQQTQCLSGDDPLVVAGVATWSSAIPAGQAVTNAVSTNVARPGCYTDSLVLTVPATVVDRTRELLRDGTQPYVVWHITGLVAPVDQAFSSAQWYTEDFRIYSPGSAS